MLNVHRITLAYKRGSSDKQYRVIILENKKNGRCLFVCRWNRRGLWGNVTVTQCPDYATAQKLWAQKVKEKRDKGYTIEDSTGSRSYENYDDFRGGILAYWQAIGKANAEFLIPGIDTTGIRDPENPEYEKTSSGRYVRKEEPVEIPPEPEPSIEERVASNPLWGAF